MQQHDIYANSELQLLLREVQEAWTQLCGKLQKTPEYRLSNQRLVHSASAHSQMLCFAGSDLMGGECHGSAALV